MIHLSKDKGIWNELAECKFVWKGMLEPLIEGLEGKNEEFKLYFVNSEASVKGFWVILGFKLGLSL